jgi:hypothetical protein
VPDAPLVPCRPGTRRMRTPSRHARARPSSTLSKITRLLAACCACRLSAFHWLGAPAPRKPVLLQVVPDQQWVTSVVRLCGPGDAAAVRQAAGSGRLCDGHNQRSDGSQRERDAI